MTRRLLPFIFILLLCGPAAAEPPPSAIASLRAPLFFGHPDAPNTLIVYTNPQCPPCRALWPVMPSLFQALDPHRAKIIVSGYGFFDEGTRLMFVAAALAEQRPDLASLFLSAVMQAGATPQLQGWDWVEATLAAPPFAAQYDNDRFRRIVNSTEAAAAYLEGVEHIRSTYHLTHTPTLVINGHIFTGPHTTRDIARELR